MELEMETGKDFIEPHHAKGNTENSEIYKLHDVSFPFDGEAFTEYCVYVFWFLLIVW